MSQSEPTCALSSVIIRCPCNNDMPLLSARLHGPCSNAFSHHQLPLVGARFTVRFLTSGVFLFFVGAERFGERTPPPRPPACPLWLLPAPYDHPGRRRYWAPPQQQRLKIAFTQIEIGGSLMQNAMIRSLFSTTAST